MADVKISQLPFATTPVDGTEVLPIVQSATTKQVSIANLTAGRAMSASSLTLTTPLAVTSGGTGIATAAQGSLLSATGADTFSATRTPTLGLAGTAAGTLGLSGSTSGVVTLATAATAGTWTFTLPTSGGTNGFILTTNGSGVTQWTNPTALGIDLNVGTTVVSDGTSGRILYNNAGVLGEYAVTGTGTTAVLSTSPTFTTGLTTPLAIGGTTASSSLTLQSTSGVGTTDSILFKVGNNGATTAATIDSAGNLGLGVTPSAWGSSFTTLQLKYGASISGVSGGLTLFRQNGYTNASGIDIYIGNGHASDYYQLNGAHVWRTAPSGTAGNAISFTQAMTLDASGNLGVGTSSPTNQLTVIAGGKTGFNISYDTSGNARSGLFMWTTGSSTGGFGGGVEQTADNVYTARSTSAAMTRYASGATIFYNDTGLTSGNTYTPTERARIDASGNLLVGTTTVAGKVTSWSTSGAAGQFYVNAATTTGTPALILGKYDNDTTTSQIFMQFQINQLGAGSGQINANGASAAAFGSYSDRRLKDNIADLPGQLSNILSLKPREFDYLSGGHQIGFVAQEMQEVYPDVVGEGDDGMLTITGWSKTEARLVSAIQELAAKVSALEARI